MGDHTRSPHVSVTARTTVGRMARPDERVPLPSAGPQQNGLDAGFIDKLFTEAGLASNDLRVCTRAAESLKWATADNKRAQDLARKAGALPLLSRLLQPDMTDDGAVKAACGAIYTLARFNPGCQDAGGEADAVSKLLVLLGGAAGPLHEETLVTALKALALLCRGHASNQAAFHRAGGVDTVVAIAAYSRFESGRLHACFALGCNGNANPGLRAEIIRAGGVRAALALLPPHAPLGLESDVELKRKRLQALAALRGMLLNSLPGQLDAPRAAPAAFDAPAPAADTARAHVRLPGTPGAPGPPRPPGPDAALAGNALAALAAAFLSGSVVLWLRLLAPLRQEFLRGASESIRNAERT